LQQDRHWLNRKRLTVYPRIFLAVVLVVAAAWALTANQMVDCEGKPLGADFIEFWSASRLALSGHPADPYSLPLIFQAEKQAVPASDRLFPFFYPPSFLLLILPLGLVPYLPAYCLWMALTLALYVLVFRGIFKGRTAMWCLAAFPGLWVTLIHGQNAFLTAALAAGAILCLRRRPLLAGVLIGLLSIKPQLALLFPIALIATGAWRALAASIATALALLGVAVAAFGRATLEAFQHHLPDAAALLLGGAIPLAKMPSVFALVRLLGAPLDAACAAQALMALSAVAALWHVWRHSLDWHLRGATLMTASLLVSPYLFDYDLAWLAFPIAWVTVLGVRDGWIAGEREVLAGAWLLPLLIAPLTTMLHLQPGPLVLGALLWVLVRRANTALPLMPPALVEVRVRSAPVALAPS